MEELVTKYWVGQQERSQRFEYRLNPVATERKRTDLDGLSRSFAFKHNEIEVVIVMPDPEFSPHPEAMGGRREYLRLRRIQRLKVGKDSRYLFIEELLILIGLIIVG